MVSVLQFDSCGTQRSRVPISDHLCLHPLRALPERTVSVDQGWVHCLRRHWRGARSGWRGRSRGVYEESRRRICTRRHFGISARVSGSALQARGGPRHCPRCVSAAESDGGVFSALPVVASRCAAACARRRGSCHNPTRQRLSRRQRTLRCLLLSPLRSGTVHNLSPLPFLHLVGQDTHSSRCSASRHGKNLSPHHHYRLHRGVHCRRAAPIPGCAPSCGVATMGHGCRDERRRRETQQRFK
mmetsp:Transcript_68038/g.160068  ORF Transcript_68038/g.160068 Transcript_68038/m.160068 type:complete len:242 (+) Transcript_68038:392-1117(+)